MTGSIERIEEFAAPPQDVWRMLTQPELLSEWFGSEVVELELRPGGRIAFRDADGSQRRALVQRVDPPRSFSFRWLPFAVRDAGTIQPVPGTNVEFTLEPAAGGTRLRIVEWGFPAEEEEPVILLPPAISRPDPPGAPPRFLLRA